MIHLDHAATGLPRLPAAIEALVRVAEQPSAGRGRHRGQAATELAMSTARAQVAELTGGGVTVFTAGATHALNQAIAGLPTPRRVGLDPLAHDAARLPVERHGAPIWLLPHDTDGRIDMARVTRDWPSDLTLVVVGHGSNVNGVLQPVPELVALAHQRGARVIVDAAQTAGVVPLTDLTKADMVCFSSHKGLRSLPGSGALVLRGELSLTPLIVGGTGIADEGPTPAPAGTPVAARLEAGTPNHPGAIAMGAAAAAFTRWPYRERAAALLDAVRRADLTAVWFGDLPTVSFTVPGLTPDFVEDALDRAFDIVCRSGRHCARQAHTTLDTGAHGTVRVSAGSSTTDADLTALTHALRAISSARP